MSEQAREVAPPDITVAIATRDRPELMREALEAVCAQQQDDIVRTILVFDQSEPGLALVDDDALRPVDVGRNHRKAGLAGARNTGIELATTRWWPYATTTTCGCQADRRRRSTRLRPLSTACSPPRDPRQAGVAGGTTACSSRPRSSCSTFSRTGSPNCTPPPSCCGERR